MGFRLSGVDSRVWVKSELYGLDSKVWTLGFRLRGLNSRVLAVGS